MQSVRDILRQRNIVLPVLIVFIQCIDDHLQMFFIAYEVRIAGIYKKCFYIMLLDILGISFLQAEEVAAVNSLLILTVPFFNIFFQPLYRAVQVDQYIRLNDLWINDLKQLLVKPEFLISKIHLCK